MNFLSVRDKWEIDLHIFLQDNDWKIINKDCFMITNDAKFRSFQFKINNRILTTNDFVYKIGRSDNRKCTFCDLYIETISHLFGTCTIVLDFYAQLINFIQDRCNVDLRFLQPRHYIFGYSCRDKVNLGLNKILLFARYFIYSSKCRNSKTLHLVNFLYYLKKQFEIEK